MPWRESSVMEERLCFVAPLLDGEIMTDVCRERIGFLQIGKRAARAQLPQDQHGRIGGDAGVEQLAAFNKIGSPGRIRTSDQPVNSGFQRNCLQRAAMPAPQKPLIS